MNAPIGFDTLHSLMAQRRSVRRFKADVPPKATIEALIAAAVTAPSASNKQPWRFCVLTDRALIEHLRGAVQATLDDVLARLNDDALAREEIAAYGRYFVRFVDAPAVIVPMCRSLAVLSHLLRGDASEAPDELRTRVAAMEQRSGVVSTSLAIQNLLLAAHASGLGASCMSGPLLAAPEIAKALALGGDWEPVCLVALGYADEAPVAPARKSAETVTRWYGEAPMNDREILERVKRCIGECLALDPATIDETSSVVDDLGADSLDFIDILFALSKAFGFKLRSAQVESFLRADFSEGKLVDGRYVDEATLAQLRPWLPALARAVGHAGDARITPAQVFSFITVETFARIVAEAAPSAGRP